MDGFGSYFILQRETSSVQQFLYNGGQKLYREFKSKRQRLYIFLNSYLIHFFVDVLQIHHARQKKMFSQLIKITKKFFVMDFQPVLDKNQFSKKIHCLGVEIPANMANKYLKDYHDFLHNQDKRPNIIKRDGDDKQRILILRNDLDKNKLDEWPETLKKLISQNNYQLIDHTLTITYDEMNMQETLQQIMPSNIVIPAGFEIVGSIAHLNLRENQLPYKHIIAQVLLDKNKTIKTVVNKTEKLNNVFRTPELEIIGGENTLDTELKEGGSIFHLNFEKVYWNSKLQAERDRLLKLFKPDEILCDMFCGIGPLSIRAAKLGLVVYANDLNPDCIYYLNINAKVNKVDKNIHTFNMDAREFVQQLVQSDQNIHFNHIYMNLPVDAIEFLDIFPGLFKKNTLIWNESNLPFIHVCGFDNGKDTNEVENNLTQRISKNLPGFKKTDLSYIHPIKDISSDKRMYCIGFKIPACIAFGNEDDIYEKIEKKIKTEQIFIVQSIFKMSFVQKVQEFPNFTCPSHSDEFYKYICLDLDNPQRLYCSDCIAESNQNLAGKLEKISLFFSQNWKISQDIYNFPKEKDEIFKRYCQTANLEEFVLMKNIENHQNRVNKIFEKWRYDVKEYYQKNRDNFKQKLNSFDIRLQSSKLPIQGKNKLLYMSEKEYIKLIEEMISRNHGPSESETIIYNTLQEESQKSDSQFSNKIENIFETMNSKINEYYQLFSISKAIQESCTPSEQNYKIDPLNNKIDSRSQMKQKSNQFSGIVENLHLSELDKQGWKMVYRVPYSQPTSIEELTKILEISGNNSRICVAAHHVENIDILDLAGFGYGNKVLQETHSTKSAVDHGEECFWYLVKNFSFGFSDSPIINLSHADINTKGKRLSWHLNGSGGYRAFNEIYLDERQDWEKIILILSKQVNNLLYPQFMNCINRRWVYILILAIILFLVSIMNNQPDKMSILIIPKESRGSSHEILSNVLEELNQDEKFSCFVLLDDSHLIDWAQSGCFLLSYNDGIEDLIREKEEFEMSNITEIFMHDMQSTIIDLKKLVLSNAFIQLSNIQFSFSFCDDKSDLCRIISTLFGIDRISLRVSCENDDKYLDPIDKSLYTHQINEILENNQILAQFDYSKETFNPLEAGSKLLLANCVKSFNYHLEYPTSSIPVGPIPIASNEISLIKDDLENFISNFQKIAIIARGSLQIWPSFDEIIGNLTKNKSELGFIIINSPSTLPIGNLFYAEESDLSSLLQHPSSQVLINDGEQHMIQLGVLNKLPILACGWGWNKPGINLVNNRKLGIGIKIKDQISPSNIVDMFEQVLTRKEFKENVEKYANILNKQNGAILVSSKIDEYIIENKFSQKVKLASFGICILLIIGGIFYFCNKKNIYEKLPTKFT